MSKREDIKEIIEVFVDWYNDNTTGKQADVNEVVQQILDLDLVGMNIEGDDRLIICTSDFKEN